MKAEKKYLHLSGLEPLVLNENSNFINVGERTNVAGSRKFLRLIKDENFDEALDIARHHDLQIQMLRSLVIPKPSAQAWYSAQAACTRENPAFFVPHVCLL